MAVARTSISSAMASGAAAITATFGAGAAAGDLGILIVETANQPVGTPGGWSLIDQPNVGTAGAAGATMCQMFYKQNITAGDISGGIAIADGGDHQNAVLATFSGYATNLPVVETWYNAVTPATTSVNLNFAAGTTPITPNDLAIACLATDRDSATVSTNSAATWNNITGSNSFIANFSSATGAGGGIIVNQLSPTGNQTGNVTFTCTITSSIYTGAILVIKAPTSLLLPNWRPMNNFLVR